MKIAKNIGTMDRVLRFAMGIVLLILAYFSAGWGAAILALFGLFCLFEGAMSWCALFHLLGKSSCPIDRK